MFFLLFYLHKKRQRQSFRLTLGFRSDPQMATALGTQATPPKLATPLILPKHCPVTNHVSFLLGIQYCAKGSELDQITPDAESESYQ